MTPFRSYLNDLVSLLYPNLCLACSDHTPARGEIICLRCQHKLPRTNFHLEQENPFTERFWGRISIENGAALYHFIKGGRVQELIHRLKYLGKREIGIRLGQWYGEQLKQSEQFKTIDLIVPVPLHPKKERLRGYNQSALFAMGISEAMGKPWMKNALTRKAFTETQTHKSRTERLENVLEVFAVNDLKGMEGKHILLVDDVMTTGATLEACGMRILEIPGTKLSMATIAIADF